MKILMVASEGVPFSKTGGLGDVVGALPQALAREGHEIRVILPFYGAAMKMSSVQGTGITFSVPLGDDIVAGELLQVDLPGSQVRTWLIKQDSFFGRPELYGGTDPYPDNDQRFVFFCKAALQALKATNFSPDVVHCHDWQAAAIPILLRHAYSDDPFFDRTSTLFTIHNIAFQGIFGTGVLKLLSVPSSLFSTEGLEFYGNASLMKGALLYSDLLNTVSPSYAREILTAEFGFGLEGVLSSRREDLFGILNGIDYSVWDPRFDEVLPSRYSSDDLSGKMLCRAHIEREASLEHSAEPLVGFVGRLTDQKGLDLMEYGLPRLLEKGFRFILLGKGEQRFHELLWSMAGRYPKRLRSFLTFDEALSHRIFAGVDLCLMPSRFEPCGLNQLIALRYGALPVVRSVGGLRDTVVDATPGNLRAGIANGFVLENHTLVDFENAFLRANDLMTRKGLWQDLVRSGMEEDFSWDRSAREYLELYKKAQARHVSTGGIS